MLFNLEGFFIKRFRPSDVRLIIDQTIKGNQIIKRLLYQDPQTKQAITHEADIPFYKKQMRLIFGKNGFMDPTSIDDYIALSGYKSVAKALGQMVPEAIIEEIKKSGLRGRGGGGYPTGKKWASCRKAKGNPEICDLQCR